MHSWDVYASRVGVNAAQDIRDKYPAWLQDSKVSLSPEDLHRYTAQCTSIQAVCKHNEEDPSNFQRLVDLIKEVSATSVLGCA